MNNDIQLYYVKDVKQAPWPLYKADGENWVADKTQAKLHTFEEAEQYQNMYEIEGVKVSGNRLNNMGII